MKNTCLLVIFTLFFILFVIGVDVARAQWSPIKESGYAVTTNWHKIDVPIGQTVVATAGTTDLSVTKIGFIWRDPSNNIVWIENITVTEITAPSVPLNVPKEVVKWAEENAGTKYRYAQSVHIPNAMGDWGIQAIFYDATKSKGKEKHDFVVRRATSINVIPDAPFVGTAGLISAMALGFGLFKFKNKKE